MLQVGIEEKKTSSCDGAVLTEQDNFLTAIVLLMCGGGIQRDVDVNLFTSNPYRNCLFVLH